MLPDYSLTNPKPSTILRDHTLYIDKTQDSLGQGERSNSFSHFLAFCFSHFKIPPLQRLRVLQLGASQLYCEQLLKDYQLDISIIDKDILSFDPLLEKHSDLRINYICDDFLSHQFEQKFDIIIDSSFTHTFTDPLKRSNCFETTKKLLKKGGFLFSEMMCAHQSLNFESNFSWDGQTLFYKQQGLRSLRECSEIEDEFLGHNFKVRYLKVFDNLNYVISFARDHSFSTEPYVLRGVFQK